MKRRAKNPAPRATVRAASPADVEEFYGLRMKHQIVEIDGVPIAMGTLARTNGQLWGWFDRREGLSARHGLAILRTMMRELRRIGEPVHVTCNEGIHEQAARLLRLVGFEPTGQKTNGFDIWVFRNG